MELPGTLIVLDFVVWRSRFCLVSGLVQYRVRQLRGVVFVDFVLGDSGPFQGNAMKTGSVLLESFVGFWVTPHKKTGRSAAPRIRMFHSLD